MTHIATDSSLIIITESLDGIDTTLLNKSS